MILQFIDTNGNLLKDKSIDIDNVKQVSILIENIPYQNIMIVPFSHVNMFADKNFPMDDLIPKVKNLLR